MLNCFCHAACDLPLVERFEKAGVGYYGGGLVECADKVFARRQVCGDFAADAAVDHGEQGCRDVYERYSAAEGCGGEAGDIADYAAADGVERGVAQGFKFDEFFVDLRKGGEGFALFARWEDDCFFVEQVRVECVHVFVGHCDGGGWDAVEGGEGDGVWGGGGRDVNCHWFVFWIWLLSSFVFVF